MSEDQNSNNSQQVPATQPGTVITPGSASPSPKLESSKELPKVPKPITEEATIAESPAASVPESTSPAEPDRLQDTESFHPEATKSTVSEVSWTANEFIAHHKTVGWYAGFAATAAILSIVIYLISKDAISVAVIIVASIVFGLYANRKPSQLEYRLDQSGLSIGPKTYSYEEFRSFSVIPEGAFSSLNFMPLKRFSPVLTVYYAPQDEAKVLAVLSSRLPFEEPRHDAVESLMRRIRF